jgi:dihydroxy-acid dehydratase
LNPGPGVCNVLGTAVTLAMMAEVLGFALPGSSLIPAGFPERLAVAEETGRQAVEAAIEGNHPDEFVTRAAFHDAWRVVCAVGGSTNAIIHLQALAGRAGIDLGWDELRDIARSTPTLAHVKPNGPFELGDLHAEGGVPAIARELSDVWHLDRRTASGTNWTTTIGSVPESPSRALNSRAEPIDPCGAISLLRGNLAPGGAVAKRSAASARLLSHVGPAVVFDGVADMRSRVHDPDLPVTEQSVLVLRGVGPIGGPGMPEVGDIPIPTKLYRAGVRDMVRISDARMSGTARGTVILHVAPEAAAGGPLGLVQDGDPIEVDIDEGRLELLVDEAELARRGQAEGRTPGPALPDRGYRRLYALHVTQANHGCDFDFLSAAPASATSPAADRSEMSLEVR